MATVAAIEAERYVVECKAREWLECLTKDVEEIGSLLSETPARMVKAWEELLGGYRVDPTEFFVKDFEAKFDELIIMRDVRFTSICEHHLLPFSGVATVGYIAQSGKVCGASKLARLVDCYARRFQMQERLTAQIGETLERHMNPLGVGVLITAKHSCMGCRGIKQPDAEMLTNWFSGVLRTDSSARAEFLQSAYHGRS